MKAKWIQRALASAAAFVLLRSAGRLLVERDHNGLASRERWVRRAVAIELIATLL